MSVTVDIFDNPGIQHCYVYGYLVGDAYDYLTAHEIERLNTLANLCSKLRYEWQAERAQKTLAAYAWKVRARIEAINE